MNNISIHEKERIKYLVTSLINGTLPKESRNYVQGLIDSSDYAQKIYHEILAKNEFCSDLIPLERIDSENLSQLKAGLRSVSFEVLEDGKVSFLNKIKKVSTSTLFEFEI